VRARECCCDGGACAETSAFDDRRAAEKARYGGESFLAEAAAEPAGTVFLDCFQRDRHTGEPKGIIAIDLQDQRSFPTSASTGSRRRRWRA
jgi:hypothetical protein